MNPTKLNTFIDLFCGIGGFHVALARHGLECVYASEIDTETAKAYSRNFRMLPDGDIRKVKAEDIPDHDVLCAGFPCQTLSIAGTKKADLSLFYEIIRIVKAKQPKVLFLENVPHIKKVKDKEGKKVYPVIERELKNAGYTVNAQVLNPSEYGIPQKRERMYFVCILGDSGVSFRGFPKPTYEKVSVGEWIKGIDVSKEHTAKKDLDFFGKLYSEKYIKKKIGKKPYTVPISANRRQTERLFDLRGHSTTIMTRGSEFFLFEQGALYTVRTLSISESKRLMTFPDDHMVYSRKQLGNAVMPAMIDKIFQQIT